MRVKMTFAVLAMATLALALPASSTAHRTATVKAGESIQAAIDAAKPGTTIKIEAGHLRGGPANRQGRNRAGRSRT